MNRKFRVLRIASGTSQSPADNRSPATDLTETIWSGVGQRRARSGSATILLARSVLVLAFLLLWVASGLAATYTWTGATSTDWGTGTNWSPNGIPGASDNIVVNMAGNVTIALNGDRSVHTVALGWNNGQTTTIQEGSGGTLSIASGGGVGTDGSSSTNHVISCPVALSADMTTDIGQAASVNFQGVISGAHGLTKTGTGKIILSAANTYSGATNIGGGRLTLNNTAALGTTPSVTASGGSLDLGGINYSTSIPLTLNGTGGWGAGALMNSGGVTGTWAGPITLAGASLISAGSNGIDLTNTTAITGAGFDLTLGGTFNGTLSAGITTGTGGLIKQGLGRWTISGASTYTGATTVNAGTLKLGGAAALGNSSGTTVNTGGTLDLNGYSVGTRAVALSGGDLTNSGAPQYNALQRLTVTSSSSIDGTNEWDVNIGAYPSPTFTVDNGATLTKNGSNNIAISGVPAVNNGSVVVNNGIFSIVSGATTSGTGWYTVNSGAALQVSSWGTATMMTNPVNVNSGFLYCYSAAGGTTGISGAIAMTGSSVVNNTAAFTLGGVISGTGSLDKWSAGALILTNDNTYTGTVSHTSGTLQIGNGGATGSLASTAITNDAAMVFNHTGSKTVPANISGTGTLTKQGAGKDIFTGDLTYGGGTTISSGTVQIGNSGTSGTISGAISNSGTIAFNRSDASSFGGAISGGGDLQLASGTLTLSGGNTYTGTTTVNGGTLSVTGSLAAGSAVSVNSGAILDGTGTVSGAITVDGGAIQAGTSSSKGILTAGSANFSTGSGSALGLRAAGFSTAGTNYDRFITTGALTLGGTSVLNLDLTGFSGTGTVTGIVQAGSITGTFATVNINNYTGGKSVSVVYNAGSIDVVIGGGGTYTWTGTTSSDWGTTSNWSIVGVPGSDANVVVNKAGGATIALNGNRSLANITLGNSSADAMTIQQGSSGTLTIASGGAISSVAGSTGSHVISCPVAISAAMTTTVNDASGMVDYQGAIGGAFALVKAGSGTVKLSATNAYSGATTVNTGTLKLNSTGAVSSSSGVSVASGAVLDMNGLNYATSVPLTLNGTGISSGGALINSNAAGATYAGLLTLGSASSVIGGMGTITLSNTGTITGSGNDLTLGGAQGGTLASIIGTGSGALTKQDASTWILAGASTYGGATTISAGTLKLGVATALPSGSAVTVTGTLDMNAFSDAIGSLAGSGTVDNVSGAGTPTLTVGGDNTSTTFSGALQNTTGALALTKSGTGTLTLSGTNTHGGATTVNAGKLLVNGIDASSAVTVNSGATLGGAGTVAGVAVTSGAVQPGSTGSKGVLTASSASFAGGASSALNLRAAAYTTAGTDYDRFKTTGALTLGGSSALNLNLTGLSGTGYITGVVQAGSIIGTFATVNINNKSGSSFVRVVYYPGSIDVVITSATYVLGGGIGTAPTPAVASNGTFTVADGTGFSKSGYTFAGWNDGTNNYVAGSTYTMGASNVMLTAQWIGAPTATSATSVTFSGFTANWDAVAGATGYYLDVATDSGFNNFATGYNNKDVANITTSAVTGLTANTTYYYRVRAYSTGGTSASSNTINPTTATTKVVTTSSDSGAGSLRQTITDANPGDVISFDATLNVQTITVTSPLAITKDLTISGPGAANLTINGGGTVQPFQINAGTSFTLEKLTVSNGAGVNGGALSDNATSTTTIKWCAFTGNSATGNGGAIYSSGTMTISDTLFNTNSADKGGAIFNNNGTLALTNITLNNNSATSNGGGVYNSAGTSTIVNATIAGNSATTQGGGIEIAGGTLNLMNSIIANNTSSNGPDIFGTVGSQGYNLIRNNTGATIGGDTTGNDTSGFDPLLGSLAANGGSAKTMALLSNSPAINKGNCANGPAVDQRGMTRTQDGTCDMGAYERGIPVTLTATSGTDQSAALNTAFTNQLKAKVVDSLGGVLDGISVAFAGPGSGANINAGGSVNTDISGIASFSAIANGTAGIYSVTATVSALYATYSLTNNLLNQTIAFTNPGNQTFGTTPALTATTSSGLTPTFTSSTTGICTVTSGRVLTFVTTGTCIIAADQTGNGSYNAAPQIIQSFSVGKATATVTLGGLSATYDGAVKAATATTAPAGKAVIFTYDGSVTAPANAGTYAVVGTINDTNYTGFANSTLVIGKASQVIGEITFSPTTLNVNGTTTVGATTTSGLAVTFASTTPSVCTVSGATITGVTVGTCTITASQTGNTNYSAAPPNSQNLTVANGSAPPALLISALSNGATTTDTTQNISGMVSDVNGIASVIVNGSTIQVNPNGSFTYPLQLLAGANTISVIVTNNAGTTTTDTRSITFDNTAPRLTVTYPPDNIVAFKKSITVTGTIASLLNSSTVKNTAKTVALDLITSINYTVNDSDLQPASITDTTYSFTTNLDDGMNTIRVSATTSAGKTVESKRTVNYQLPTFSLAITDPATDVHLILGSYLLSGTVTDNTTPVAVTITMDDQSYKPTVTNGTFQQQLSFTGDKIYQISVTGVDHNNNRQAVQRNIIHSVPKADDVTTASVSFTIVDALLALRMATGTVTPTSSQIMRMDVAPMVKGISVGDGAIDVEDALVILYMAIGLI